MDLMQIIIGVIIGAVVASAIFFIMLRAQGKSADKAGHSEAELKAILAAQARVHLDSSAALIGEIESKAHQLKEQLQNYEQSLASGDIKEDDSQSSFFGEHASVYLRNSTKKDKKDPALANTEAQPRDFSGNSSGLFVGGKTDDLVIEQSSERKHGKKVAQRSIR